MSKLILCSLRYVASLRLRLILRSALHLCRLCPFLIPVLHPPHAYSKMFVGGLSWDTTDVTLSLLILPPLFAMSCPFTNSLNCAAVAACNGFFALVFPYAFYNQTACGTIFRNLAKSTHAPSFGTHIASRAALRSLRSRTQPHSMQS